MNEGWPKIKVFANGEWHPMPMTPADAGRLIRERDAALAEVERLKNELQKINERNDQ